MSDRTFQWWKLKLGFRGDEEFLHLAELAPDRRTYLAAVGLVVALWDAAHLQDKRVPAGVLRRPADDQLIGMLVEAGLMLEDGGVTEAMWSRWRLEDRRVFGGRVRAENAKRDPAGHFLAEAGPAHPPAEPAIETETETEKRTIARARENERSTERTARPTRIGDELAKAPWNNRESKP